MRKIVYFFTLAITVSGIAQENDSAVLNKNNVMVQQKMLYIHSFGQDRDSCLFNEKRYNEKGMVEFEKTDLKCLGYGTFEEVYIRYDDQKVVEVEVHRDGNPFNITKNTFKKKETSPSASKTFYFQTNDSSSMETEYFLTRKGRLDSSYTTTVNQQGEVKKSMSIARYNKNDNLVQLTTLNEKGLPIEQASYEVDDDGHVLSAAFQSYGESADFIQTMYTIDSLGRVASSYNTVNQKQEYFYLPNGLLKNVYSYNPKGELESEFIFIYKLRE